MLPPAVAEQQAKLGVSAEESKEQRLKRQQARFRDRGRFDRAFVPSTSNPLVDILLARTVSGESPSKACPKDVSAKRLSPRKPRQVSPTRKRGAAVATRTNEVVAARSKPSSRKGKAKASGSEADPATKPSPKRRGMVKGKRKTPDPGSATDQPLPARSRSTSKGKGKQRANPPASEGNSTTKPKPKVKTRLVKEVVGILDSDDDQTLVEVSRKAESKPKRNIRHDCDSETDDDPPIIRKHAMSRVDDSRTSNIKTTVHAKAEKIADMGGSRKKMLEDEEERWQDKPKTLTKKRLVLRDEDEDVAIPPAKKGKATGLTSMKHKVAFEPEPAPRPIKDVENRKGSKATRKDKRRDKADSVQDIVEVAEDGNGRPPERASEPKKRRKEDVKCDDRPRKLVKFSEIGAPHSSSKKLKENKPDEKREHTSKSIAEDDSDASHPKLATRPKGPPREVLERIKASAMRHLRCVDSEPDELDCLS